MLESEVDNLKQQFVQKAAPSPITSHARDKDCIDTATLNQALNEQSEHLTNKLNEMAHVIRDSNIDLVKCLTSNISVSNNTAEVEFGVTRNQREYSNTVAQKNPSLKNTNKKGTICCGPNKPSLKIANPNIGERLAKLSWIFLANLEVNTSPADITEILDPQYNHLYKCEKLKSKYRNPRSAAFKLGVPELMEPKCLAPDFWPDGCYVDHYRFRNHNKDMENEAVKQKYSQSRNFRYNRRARNQA